MLDATTLALGGTGGTVDKTTTARSSLGQTYDQFLSLLTTQLKNQDPLNPMDSNAFTNQLISMAGVEQQLAQTDKMDQLIQLNQANTINTSMLSYIGMTVDYKGSDFTYSGGTAVQFGYTNAADAADTTINVYDKSNNLVYTAAGDKSSGDHTIVWPGTNTDGTKVAEGDYRFEVVSKDSSGTPVSVTTPVSNFTYSSQTDATLKYNLASDAKATKVSILDSNGSVIWTGNGDTSAGDHTIKWPGVDSNGKPVTAGSYSIQVGAEDANKKAIITTTTVPATVSGVQADKGAIELIIGNQKVPINSVTSVRLANSNNG